MHAQMYLKLESARNVTMMQWSKHGRLGVGTMHAFLPSFVDSKYNSVLTG